MQNFPWADCAAAVLLLLLLAPLVSTQCPSDSGDWMLFRGACYKFYNESQFWSTAETVCKESQGHLVSIESDHENRLVGKLSLCRDVWIGRYATDLHRLGDAASYAWTDESQGNGYSRHAFSENATIFMPLIRSLDLYWRNSLHHEQHPFVCKARTTGESSSRCPSSMQFYQGNCYLLSGFEANFIEANFYCQNRSTQLTSVLNEAELRFLNALDLGADSCQLESTWLGLVKLNPCFPDRGGRELCYQWADFSGKHLGFPRWAEGQPEGSEDQGCVVITGDQLVHASCSERRKFVCKAPAESLKAGSPAWQMLDEPPSMLTNESSDLETITKINISSEVPVPEATATAETTEAAPTTAAAPTVATTPEEARTDAPAPAASEPTALGGASEAASSKSTARMPEPSKMVDSERQRSKDENEAVEDRFPWALDNVISDVLSLPSDAKDGDLGGKRSELPTPSTPPQPTQPPPTPANVPEPAYIE